MFAGHRRRVEVLGHGMNQAVNFYRGSARPRAVPLSAEWIVRAWLVTVLLLLCLTMVQVVLNQRLQARVGAAEKQATISESHLRELQLLHPEPKPDPVLVSDLEHMQRTVHGLNRLIEAVKGDDLVQRRGFTGYFDALARQVLPDVWLTGIQLTKGGEEIELSGSAVVSESIPKLVGSLGLQPAFRGRTFSDLVVRRPEKQQDQINFVLRTTHPPLEKHAKN